MKLINEQFAPESCCFLGLGFEYLLQHPLLEHPALTLLKISNQI